MATKLGAVAKCVFVELLHGCRGGWSEIKSFHRLEVSSLVLYISFDLNNKDSFSLVSNRISKTNFLVWAGL